MVNGKCGLIWKLFVVTCTRVQLRATPNLAIIPVPIRVDTQFSEKTELGKATANIGFLKYNRNAIDETIHRRVSAAKATGGIWLCVVVSIATMLNVRPNV